MSESPSRQQIGESHRDWWLRRQAETAIDNARLGKSFRVATIIARAILLRCPQMVDGVMLDVKCSNLGAGVQQLTWQKWEPALIRAAKGAAK